MTEIFIDTTIAITNYVGDTRNQTKIATLLASYSATATSEIVRLEFIRRMLGDVKCILNMFNAENNFGDVLHRISRWTNEGQKNVALNILGSLFSHFRGDEDFEERCKHQLRLWIITGVIEFNKKYIVTNEDSGCACADDTEIKEIKPFTKYDFPSKHCDQQSGKCKIISYLSNNEQLLKEIYDHLITTEEKSRSKQIIQMISSIKNYFSDKRSIYQSAPCKELGDLLIAIQSRNYKTFYTSNKKESQHLCRSLKQDLYILSGNPDIPDKLYAMSDNSWPPIL